MLQLFSRPDRLSDEKLERGASILRFHVWHTKAGDLHAVLITGAWVENCARNRTFSVDLFH